MVVGNILKANVLNAFRRVQYPGFVTFVVTWRCNARCVFCDVWKKPDTSREDLSVDEVRNIFGQLKNVEVLRLTGGEPFLRKDLADIVNAVEEVNAPAMVHITSNGFLTDRMVAAIKAIKPVHKLHLKVSIDSVGKKHDEVRGIPNAYKKAMKSVQEIAALRDEMGFHLGVNQAIMDEQEIESFFKLRDILSEYDVPIYPVIAHEADNTLYSVDKVDDPNVDVSLKPLGEYSDGALRDFFRTLMADASKVGDIKERMVDQYHLQGLYNRLVEGVDYPNPRCMALNNHLRILPNGDVPTCLFNGTVVGNLRDQKFDEVWFGEEADRLRKWVGACPGCWQSCETAVSAIYTGDIWRGLVPKKI